jgi:ribokinase
MITVVPGANAALGADDAEATVADMAKGDILMLQLETPLATVAAALSAARKKGVTAILNMAPFTKEAVPLAAEADIVIVNRLECCGLVGRNEVEAFAIDEALQDLHRETGRCYIATLGAEGAVAIHDGAIVHAPSLSIACLDTIGAGDTFCGYFAAGLDLGRNFAESLSRAALAGSLACLKPGAQTAIPLSREVEKAVAEEAISAAL